jgi:hypothetical protein
MFYVLVQHAEHQPLFVHRLLALQLLCLLHSAAAGHSAPVHPVRQQLRLDYTVHIMSLMLLHDALLCCRFRRLTLWLPHGLARDNSLADIQSSIRVCCLANPFGSLDSTCNNQVFDLSRPYPAVLTMRVPALNPGQRCVVRVSAQPKVR